MVSIKVDEVCKVRRDAVKREGAGYALAVLKKMNKTTARVIVYDDYLANNAVLHTVQLKTLWKVKATQRTHLVRKALGPRVPLEPPVPAPLFCRIEPISTVVMGIRVVSKLQITGSAVQVYVGHDSVVNFSGDAIVNAANEGCLGGGGIDGEINRRGGQVLLDARGALPMVGTGIRCKTGDAKMTTSGDLPCAHVIHAVGPRFRFFGIDDDHTDDLGLLASAYMNSLQRAREANLKSIGFCLLSAGIFRGSCPLETVVKCALETIARNPHGSLETIVLCAFTDEEQGR